MISSEACIDLIKQFEGCKLKAYKCPAGVWTIGYGRTTDVKEGDTCTQEQADNWLTEEVDEFAHLVMDMVKVPLTQHELDALTSFAYNVGLGALRKSTLLKRINESDFDAAAEEFTKWNKAGGNVLPGLVKRRKAERDLFLS